MNWEQMNIKGFSFPILVIFPVSQNQKEHEYVCEPAFNWFSMSQHGVFFHKKENVGQQSLTWTHKQALNWVVSTDLG